MYLSSSSNLLLIKPTKNKKKKNKKKSKKSKKPPNNLSDEDLDKLCQEFEQLDNSLIEIAESSKKLSSSSSKKSNQNKTNNPQNLLKIDTRSLNPNFELNKIFGKNVIIDRNKNSGYNKNSQQIKSLYPRSLFVEPRIGIWAPCQKLALSMNMVDEKSNSFCYTHTSAYRATEKRFRLAIELNQTHIFNEIQADRPYHVNTLLQLSDYYNSQQDYNSEREMLEKCIYGLEAAFDSRLSLADDKLYLNYKNPENRGLFICIYRLALSLSRRACNKTAFEYCKLCFKLDRSDPLGIWLMIDHFALLSGHYQWIVDLFGSKDDTFKQLKKLPNWNYSAALAAYRLQNDESFTSSGSDSDAVKSMVSAIIRFPGLLILLTEALNIDVSDSEKAKLLSMDNSEKYLIALYKLYVERSVNCWSGDQIMPFLYNCTQRALSAFREYLDPSDDNSHNKYKLQIEQSEILRSSYKKLPDNILRHFMLSGLKEPQTFIMKNYGTEKIFCYDPFPPKDGIITYIPLPENWREETMEGRLSNSGVRNFFESFLRPGMSINDMINRALNEERAGIEDQSFQEQLRQNLFALLDGQDPEEDDEEVRQAVEDFRNEEVD